MAFIDCDLFYGWVFCARVWVGLLVEFGLRVGFDCMGLVVYLCV